MKTLEELQTTHSEMCATAGDLGMAVPPALAIDFTNVEQGEAICKALDAAIVKFREGIDEGAGAGGVEEISGQETSGGITEEAPTPAKKPRKPKADKQVLAKPDAKVQGASASAKKSKPKAEPAVKEEKTTVAKKAVAKKAAAPAKKAATPAKKDAAPKKAAAGALDDNAKVNWVGVKGENPYRGDKKERYEKLRKASGKTVKTIIAGGVPSETLRNAVKNKIVTLA